MTTTTVHELTYDSGPSVIYRDSVAHSARCSCGWERFRYTGSALHRAVQAHLRGFDPYTGPVATKPEDDE